MLWSLTVLCLRIPFSTATRVEQEASNLFTRVVFLKRGWSQDDPDIFITHDTTYCPQIRGLRCRSLEN